MDGIDGRPTGRFTFDAKTGKWDWDDEVFRIHGIAPGSVTPTTELVLASKHPEDRERVRRLLDRVSSTAEPFSLSYRIVAADGVERRVVLVGESSDGDGSGTTLEGYYLDLTSDFDAEIHHAIETTAQHRATIEQAKGVLMLVYGLNDTAAFAMLRWWSRNGNIKVRDLAASLVAAVRDGDVTSHAARQSVDVLLHDLSSEAP